MLRFAAAACAAASCAPSSAQQDAARLITEYDWQAASDIHPARANTIPGTAIVAINAGAVLRDSPRTNDLRMGNESGLRLRRRKKEQPFMRLPPCEERSFSDPLRRHAAGNHPIIDRSQV
jgi:hypothetical protein